MWRTPRRPLPTTPRRPVRFRRPSIIGCVTDLDTRVARPHAPLLRRAAPALLGYAAVRALGLVVLVLWSAARGKSAYTLLTARWDALWYTRVAKLGYGYEVRLPNGDVHSNLAFFPLLPWLERSLHALTPLSYADAGFAVSLLASLAAACGIFAVAERVYGPRTGLCAVLLWAVLPVGVVQSMAYSESLFTALAAWSLYALLTGRWITMRRPGGAGGADPPRRGRGGRGGVGVGPAVVRARPEGDAHAQRAGHRTRPSARAGRVRRSARIGAHAGVHGGHTPALRGHFDLLVNSGPTGPALAACARHAHRAPGGRRLRALGRTADREGTARISGRPGRLAQRVRRRLRLRALRGRQVHVDSVRVRRR